MLLPPCVRCSIAVRVALVRYGPKKEFLIKDLSASYVTRLYDPSSFTVGLGITKMSSKKVISIEMKIPLTAPNKAPIWLFQDLSFNLVTSLASALTMFQTISVTIRIMIINAIALDAFPLPKKSVSDGVYRTEIAATTKRTNNAPSCPTNPFWYPRQANTAITNKTTKSYNPAVIIGILFAKGQFTHLTAAEPLQPSTMTAVYSFL